MRRIGINKKRDANTGFFQRVDNARQFIVIGDNIKPAFRRHFLAFFRHNAARIGLMAQRNLQHFFGCRHFKIERQTDTTGQTGNVIIANMAAIFAQMRSNTISTGARRKFMAARTGSGKPRRAHYEWSPHGQY